MTHRHPSMGSIALGILILTLVACDREPTVTLQGGRVEGDPYSSQGATLVGDARIRVSRVDSAEDVFSPDGSSKVLLRAPGGAGVTFDCICKAGGTNLNCDEKCTIDITTGTAECTCSAIGCQNCAADLGLSSRSIRWMAMAQESRTVPMRDCGPLPSGEAAAVSTSLIETARGELDTY